MEMNFREYCEGVRGTAIGAGLGYGVGSMVGGPLLGIPAAAVGGWLGHKGQEILRGDQHQTPKVDPQYFVYYREPDPTNPRGRVAKELLRQPYEKPDDPRYEQSNADPNHPYYYYFVNGKPVKKIKAAYMAYQRQNRYQRSKFGQQPQHRRG